MVLKSCHVIYMYLAMNYSYWAILHSCRILLSLCNSAHVLEHRPMLLYNQLEPGFFISNKPLLTNLRIFTGQKTDHLWIHFPASLVAYVAMSLNSHSWYLSRSNMCTFYMTCLKKNKLISWDLFYLLPINQHVDTAAI